MAYGGAWFRPKEMGYGATPVTWQGWLVTLAFVVVIALTMGYLNTEPRGGLPHLLGLDRLPLLRDLRPNTFEVIVALAVELFAFLGLARWKSSGPWMGR